jgi:hypothetical protein
MNQKLDPLIHQQMPELSNDSDSGISVGLMDVHGSIEQSDGTANLRYPARNSILSWLIGRYSYLLQKTS